MINQCVKLCHVAARPCRLCGVMLYFVPLRQGGNQHPFNEEGTSHFATCPGADQFRSRKRGATPPTSYEDAERTAIAQEEPALFDHAPLPD